MKHAILGAALSVALAVPAFAQDYMIMAPASPGGGWDQTARTMQEVLVLYIQDGISVGKGIRLGFGALLFAADTENQEN